MSENENMSVWQKLEITDPKHTKEFKRAGGFSGTAIRPMYAIQRMTELFGVCGQGWGYTKPEYTVQTGTDGQILVYCVVGLWHIAGGEKSELIYGVGGDFIIVKQSSGTRSDDEAFKKAFTDALMNAMKHIGMSADIHMNQFDANKYVQPEPKKGMQGRMADNKDIQDDLKANGYDPKAVYDDVIEELGKCETTEMLNYWVKVNKTSGRMRGLPTDFKEDVTNRYNTLKQYFLDQGK